MSGKKSIKTVWCWCSVFLVATLLASCDSPQGCTGGVDSAEFNLDPNNTGTLLMSGIIDCSTQSKLDTALASDAIDTIVMESVEGSEDDVANIAMATSLAAQRLHIAVADGGLIASGGVDFFLAGATRSIGLNSVVGVHSWETGDGEQGIDVYNANPSAAGHQLYIGYYAQYVSGLRDGRPDNDLTDAATDFYVYTLQVAPAEGLHCMTSQELVDWGIVTDTVVAADLKPVVSGDAHPNADACTH